MKLLSGPNFAPYVAPESADGGLIVALAREALAVSGNTFFSPSTSPTVGHAYRSSTLTGRSR